MRNETAFEQVRVFLVRHRKCTVARYLGLEGHWTTETGHEALSARKRWAQGRMNNPRYGEEARWVLKHFAALTEVLEDETPDPAAAPAPRGPVPMDPWATELIRAYWEGLGLDGGLLAADRKRLVEEEAARHGVTPDALCALIPDYAAPAAMAPPRLVPSVPEAPSPRPRLVEKPAPRVRQLGEDPDPTDELTLEEPMVVEVRDASALVDFVDTMHGLMLQGLMSVASLRGLQRQAALIGLDGELVRELLLLAETVEWDCQRGMLDPFAIFSVNAAQPMAVMRQRYRRLRSQALGISTVEDAVRETVRLDAAWSVVSKRQSQPRPMAELLAN